MLESPRFGERPGLKKKFDGKAYLLFDVKLSKQSADIIASKLRSNNYLARVTKSNSGYMIWFRD